MSDEEQKLEQLPAGGYLGISQERNVIIDEAGNTETIWLKIVVPLDTDLESLAGDIKEQAARLGKLVLIMLAEQEDRMFVNPVIEEEIF
jgi:hypothetical protein